MNKPIVSVCTITYKHEKYIAETIEGVLMQEVDFPIEFVIADDCSPDNTEKVVRHYIDNHPRGHWIKYTRHKQNKGMIPNFIWALKQCKGKYIALCDGDDYWIDPNKLQKQVDFLEENEDFVISFHNCEEHDEVSGLIKSSFLPKDRQRNLDQLDLMTGGWLPTLSVLFRRMDIVNEIPKSFYKVINADTFLWSILGQYGKAYFDRSISAVHILHQNGVWGKRAALYKMKNSIDTLFEMYNYHNNYDEVRLYIIYKINLRQKQIVKYNFRNVKFINGIKESYKLMTGLFMYFKLKNS